MNQAFQKLMQDASVRVKASKKTKGLAISKVNAKCFKFHLFMSIHDRCHVCSLVLLSSLFKAP
jgi:hypothetical protein